jgi:spore coat polysaccharide biosynthesis predicted glycosyltransferase SpsG
MTSAVLVVPCCEEGKGGGHLTRCIKLTSDLRAGGREAYFFFHNKTEKIINLLQSKNFNPS